jgi:hypothetical protein
MVEQVNDAAKAEGPRSVSDVGVGRGLYTVLDLADAGEVLTRGCGQRRPGEAGILVHLTKAGAERLLRLSGGTSTATRFRCFRIV